jgi:hypothetical protein
MVRGARDGRLERRDLRASARELRLCPRGVELGSPAGIEPHLGEVERGALVRDVATRDIELLLLAAQLEVGASDFGGHDHLRIAQARFGGAHLGARRFRSAAEAAEEIELPERIEARIVELLISRNAGHRLHGRQAPIGVAGTGGDRRREVETSLATQRAHFGHACESDAQVVVRGRRIVHEALQRLVLEQRPELRDGILRRVRRVRSLVETLRHRRCGPHVVGPDGAARERCGEQRQRDSTHGSPPTRALRRGGARRDDARERKRRV